MGPAPWSSERGSRRVGPRGLPGLRRSAGVRYAVGALLAELGTTAVEVAESLQAAGVTGSRGDPRDCAVARYLGAVVGGERDVAGVSVGRSVLWLSRRGLRPAVRVPLPVPVRHFVAAFDAGAHPELDRDARSASRS